MVEMLMTAFIMAVGILGLTMLLVMSLKGSRGGRSLSTAVLVAEHVMDRAEMEGRLSWLNVTDTSFGAPSLADFNPPLRYITIPVGGNQPDTFNVNGDWVAAADPTAYFRVRTVRAAFAPDATGALSDFTVQVQFSDQVDPANAPIVRTVTLTRRIAHG
jgi:Tfp pilus assembly protein PilV